MLDRQVQVGVAEAFLVSLCDLSAGVDVLVQPGHPVAQDLGLDLVESLLLWLGASSQGLVDVFS